MLLGVYAVADDACCVRGLADYIMQWAAVAGGGSTYITAVAVHMYTSCGQDWCLFMCPSRCLGMTGA